MLKLKLQYFGHLMWRADSFERTLMLGKIKGRRRRDNRGWDGWMASPTQRTWVWVNSRSWWWTGRPGVLWFMGFQRVRHDWATELNWTEWYIKTNQNILIQNVFISGPLFLRSLGWEDPLEEDMAAHSSILTWRIPWTEEPGRLQSMWSHRSDMTEAT